MKMDGTGFLQFSGSERCEARISVVFRTLPLVMDALLKPIQASGVGLTVQ